MHEPWNAVDRARIPKKRLVAPTDAGRVLAQALAPTAAGLACTKLGLELAARVGREQLTGLEPVFGAGACK